MQQSCQKKINDSLSLPLKKWFICFWNFSSFFKLMWIEFYFEWKAITYIFLFIYSFFFFYNNPVCLFYLQFV